MHTYVVWLADDQLRAIGLPVSSYIHSVTIRTDKEDYQLSWEIKCAKGDFDSASG
jgi:hypothetical protein